ncbi:hypothetical protein IAQ61_000979 [Plenodomus lingam]|uniref:uncharacterized protein n=1 Tax=Leptosphaeria maculans TaxID=5022 RepID=UPI00331E620F|nr:hypothetical protein IAQ61_000979 [Plenodomus lingam]
MHVHSTYFSSRRMRYKFQYFSCFASRFSNMAHNPTVSHRSSIDDSFASRCIPLSVLCTMGPGIRSHHGLDPALAPTAQSVIKRRGISALDTLSHDLPWA